MANEMLTRVIVVGHRPRAGIKVGTRMGIGTIGKDGQAAAVGAEMPRVDAITVSATRA